MKQLGDALEMRVARDQEKIMFQCEGCDPQVIGGNWRARAPELDKQTRVWIRRFPGRQQHSNGWFGEQITQQNLVPMLLGSSQEAGLEFRQDH